MKLYWKQLGLATVAVAGLLASGCSGIHAGQSVSPATFLLPGFGHARPGAPLPALAIEGPANPTTLVAAR